MKEQLTAWTLILLLMVSMISCNKDPALDELKLSLHHAKDTFPFFISPTFFENPKFSLYRKYRGVDRQSSDELVKFKSKGNMFGFRKDSLYMFKIMDTEFSVGYEGEMLKVGDNFNKFRLRFGELIINEPESSVAFFIRNREGEDIFPFLSIKLNRMGIIESISLVPMNTMGIFERTNSF